jgi:geranylgeranyl diphosphate synthase type II
MYSQKELSKYFEQKLKQEKFEGSPSQLYDPIQYMIDLGGKRLRPILTLMACGMFDDNIKKALPQAFAIELFHNFTLIHDDIMDNAPVRRGKTTVYKKWDSNTAILSGDTLFAMAYLYAQKADMDILSNVLSVFSKTAIEVCEGQQFDLEFERKEVVSVKEYIEMIRLKTGVLFAASLKIGAIIGRAPKDDIELLYRFGETIGLGFQLQDDYLDTFGNEKVFGKKTGGDIVTNKKTYLYLKALEKADATTKKQLLKLYSKTGNDENKKITTVKSIFKNLGVDKDTTDLINGYFKDSTIILDKLGVSDDKKLELLKIAENMIKRNK